MSNLKLNGFEHGYLLAKAECRMKLIGFDTPENYIGLDDWTAYKANKDNSFKKYFIDSDTEYDINIFYDEDLKQMRATAYPIKKIDDSMPHGSLHQTDKTTWMVLI
tara:strand:+ start:773 stop:1090 length:318 start_codon:yes stop_codon:yes gene_type:complete